MITKFLLLHISVLLREHKLELNAAAPVPNAFRCLKVVINLCVYVYRLLPDHEDFSCATANRNSPLVAAFCFPIGCDDRGTYQIPSIIKVVVGKPLGKTEVYVGVAPSNIPEVVYYTADHPIARHS